MTELATSSSQSAGSVTNQCLNCGASLAGPWCAQCGQQHREGPPSLSLFFGELLAALTHADSRFWRTLRALIFKPGFLAREFFDGRRAHYLPPVRLYLGLSLIFFLWLSWDTQLEARQTADRMTPEQAEVLDQKLAALDQTETIAPKLRKKLREERVADGETCDNNYSGPLSEYLSPRVKEACLEIERDGGVRFVQSFLAKLPTAMFVLMPLFAAVMKLWYWRPKRWFTEHLVLQVNNHSAIFLFALVGSVLDRVFAGLLGGFITSGIALYTGIYSYRSLRVYYQQSPVWTRFKFFSLMLVYFGLLFLVLGFTGLASLFGL